MASFNTSAWPSMKGGAGWGKWVRVWCVLSCSRAAGRLSHTHLTRELINSWVPPPPVRARPRCALPPHRFLMITPGSIPVTKNFYPSRNKPVVWDRRQTRLLQNVKVDKYPEVHLQYQSFHKHNAVVCCGVYKTQVFSQCSERLAPEHQLHTLL